MPPGHGDAVVRRGPIALVVLAISMTGPLALAEPAAAAPVLTASSAEQDFLARMNHERTTRGLAPLN